MGILVKGGKDNESIIDQNSNGYAASVTDRNVANHYQYGNVHAKTTQLFQEILITFCKKEIKTCRLLCKLDLLQEILMLFRNKVTIII
jgi:hypothetical protein